MSNHTVHTIQTAPEQSKPVLERLQRTFGLVPNIAGAMAASPTLINGFIGLFERVHASSLSEPQIQTLLLTNAVTNRSEWAAAFHTALALQQGVSRADVDAIREARLPADVNLAALSALARTLIDRRGRIDRADEKRFIDAGFGAAQILDVIAVVAASTITNYTGSVTQPPLEEQFAEYAWQAPTR
ncbi:MULTISPECIES: carboxymuconolactone decarboxylase family protein [unclassified Caballeronia]|uniref:carboxymuconolactone decarboxylase family protein n=1 Tax=unclassified Caballeronia TaxID=2646786 RepID=UPI0028635F8B|nr:MULTISPECIES: carboxymuconolactone decarboxylase family protein [unclassified Caballeronia]MDR5774929.1 carboxymuconolactone decarboxylase family protein [Caballeronia sp. LZ002]MDR5850365.1 carboxymuconolactone decarboxylase family protein [Caballeronia sp. LZ003]